MAKKTRKAPPNFMIRTTMLDSGGHFRSSSYNHGFNTAQSRDHELTHDLLTTGRHVRKLTWGDIYSDNENYEDILSRNDKTPDSLWSITVYELGEIIWTNAFSDEELEQLETEF